MINRLLNVENLSFSYDSKIVLDNISFEVDKNTINACLCPNKCGKTTLIRLISGVDELKDGNVSINGINLDKDNPILKVVGGVLFNNDYSLLIKASSPFCMLSSKEPRF